MDRQVTRRGFLALLGGGAVGTVFSPLPWKLLDDAAIWTQNWSWLPRLPRGEVRTHASHCTLCPAGCGISVRTVGGEPFGISPIPGHPLSGGALCPLGFAAHHMAYHPCRLTDPIRRVRERGPLAHVPIAMSEAISEARAWIGAAGGKGAVAVLDARPERVISTLYRWLLEPLGGVYVAAPGGEASFDALDEMLIDPPGPVGLDLAAARTCLSFGAPLLDGWGSPGALPGDVHIIQIETRPSRTALHAGRWLRLHPGTEATLALGIAHVILAEGWANEPLLRERGADFATYRQLALDLTPARTAELTGIGEGEIRAAARRFAQEGPSLALAGTDPGGGPLPREAQLAVWGLNLLVGSFGPPGGIVRRRAPAAPRRRLGDLPDRSIQLLLLDPSVTEAAFPWSLVARKLAGDQAKVISLSPYDAGMALRADLVLPAPAPMETRDEVTAPATAPADALALSRPLRRPPKGVLPVGEMLRQLAGEAAGFDYEALLREKVAAIEASARGSVYEPATGESTPLSGDLTSALEEGACWVDERPAAWPLPEFRLLGGGADARERMRRAVFERPNDAGLVLMPWGWRGAAGAGALPQVAAKLYRESHLRGEADSARIHPETGRSAGLRDGGRARLGTPAGFREVVVAFDAAVLPGVIHVATGPANSSFGDVEPVLGGLVDLCRIDESGSWRLTPVTVGEA